MAPVPGPISRLWHGWDFSNEEAIITKPSVSGRGMKTGGLIFRVSSKKSHSLIMYCTGT